MPDKPDEGEPLNEMPVNDSGETQEPAEPVLSLEEVQASVEALLYASGEPITLRSLKKTIPEAPDLIAGVLKSLKQLYDQSGRGLQIVEVAGGWQITTRPELHERVGRLFDTPRPSRLSIQALETLAVIAYRQPTTIPEIMELRATHSVAHADNRPCRLQPRGVAGVGGP